MIDTPDIIQISVSMTTSSLSTNPFNIIFLSRIIFFNFSTILFKFIYLNAINIKYIGSKLITLIRIFFSITSKLK